MRGEEDIDLHETTLGALYDDSAPSPYPEIAVEVVEPHEPYGMVPGGPDGILGWFISSAPGESEWERRTVLLSEVGNNSASVEEVIKVISHEYLHDVLEREASFQASLDLDNLVHDGNFVVDRPENRETDE